MGREFYAQAVVKAYDGNCGFIREEIIPLTQLDTDGADLLISQKRRIKNAIRFISVRSFDSSGKRLIDWRLRYDSDGNLQNA